MLLINYVHTNKKQQAKMLQSIHTSNKILDVKE